MRIALRVAVIGVGALGKHHARILASLPGVTWPPSSTSTAPARRRSPPPTATRPLFDAGQLDGQIDAVTIAVPTELHARVARAVPRSGASPCSSRSRWRGSVDEADAMIAARRPGRRAGRRAHRTVQSGRCGGAPLLADPRFIEVHRLGAFPERSLDIDVVFDLMIHDLDVVLSLVPSEVESIEAVGVPVLTGRVDIANARLRFANGCIANLTASRISRDRVRKIRFFQPAPTCRLTTLRRSSKSGGWSRGLVRCRRSRAARSKCRTRSR